MTGPSASRCSSSAYSRFAVGQPEPPAVVVDHDRDVVRVVERRRAALERRVVEVPLRRRGSPDQLRELAAVAVVAGTSALGGEVVLVPPLQLGLRRQRLPARCLAADQVAAHRHEAVAALRPERGDDVGRPRAPVEAGDDGRLDPERVHQGDRVDRERRLLAVAERLVGEEARRAVAAQVRDDHPVAGRRQQRDDVGVAVDVVRPAVQEDGRGTVGRAVLHVADVEDAGVDLLDDAEPGARWSVRSSRASRPPTAPTPSRRAAPKRRRPPPGSRRSRPGAARS